MICSFQAQNWDSKNTNFLLFFSSLSETWKVEILPRTNHCYCCPFSIWIATWNQNACKILCNSQDLVFSLLQVLPIDNFPTFIWQTDNFTWKLQSHQNKSILLQILNGTVRIVPYKQSFHNFDLTRFLSFWIGLRSFVKVGTS